MCVLGLFQAFCLSLNNGLSYPFFTRHCVAQLFPFLLLQVSVYLPKALPWFLIFSCLYHLINSFMMLIFNFFSLFPCPQTLALTSRTPLTNPQPCFSITCHVLRCTLCEAPREEMVCKIYVGFARMHFSYKVYT